MRSVAQAVFRFLDSRWLSRVRAVFWLVTVGIALLASGVVTAVIKALTELGPVPLGFIGLGLFVLLIAAAVGLRRKAATSPATMGSAGRGKPTPNAVRLGRLLTSAADGALST